MILKVDCYLEDKINHNCNTVREFIENIIEKTEDKENKYFKISTKVGLSGNRNMILYYQDGILKSHHTTRQKFDYKLVLDYEIYDEYYMGILKMNNILSYDFDSREELKKFIEQYYYSNNTCHYINLDVKDIISELQREQEEKRIQEQFLNNSIPNIEEIDKVLKMLIDKRVNPKETLNLKGVVREIIEEVEKLKGKVSYLESQLNKK
ncbi:hypothetical protein [Clostridium thermobutyricum]|uniref:Uncharacterized protein n=1 Tax=Clostridium thermobutyricum DSM 4928 TaxID=1121339 RepID=A0A1V4SWP1_9CLOT|nr:hypothetical protein [Clostridium thermobutyricum]OPX47852.1 hypothetical protein CLTHE_14230 [Clostridium thermobutyricum DSM 4928]